MTLLTLLKIPEKRTVEQILRFIVETHLEYIFYGREQISQLNLFRGNFFCKIWTCGSIFWGSKFCVTALLT